MAKKSGIKKLNSKNTKIEEKQEEIVADPDVKKDESENRKEDLPEVNDPFPNKELLRYDEVADFWRVDRRTVRMWVDHGSLESIKSPGGGVRITKKSFEKFVLLKK